MSTAEEKEKSAAQQVTHVAFSRHTCWILIVWQLHHRDRGGSDKA